MFERAKAACFLVGVLVLSGCAEVVTTNLRTPASTPPGRSFPGCNEGAGEARVCINLCKTVIQTVGGGCTNDPCDASELGVCGDLFDCVPNDSAHPTFGTCQRFTALLCHVLEPRMGDNLCPAGFSCIPFDCNDRQSPNARYDGECIPPTREGQPCDESCRRCEAGTICESSLPGNPRICRRKCTDDGDCVVDTYCLPTVGFRLITDRSGEPRLVPVTRFCVCSGEGEIPPDGGGCCHGFHLVEGFCRSTLF